MIQKQFRASWVSSFKNHMNTQLDKQPEPFITLQFSSIGVDGYPKSRTVVYRGFLFNDESTNVISFTTDKRMDKYAELMKDDKFEAVFYFNHAKRQFRFRGHARILDNEHSPSIDLNNFKPRDVGTSDSDTEDETENTEGKEDTKVKDDTANATMEQVGEQSEQDGTILSNETAEDLKLQEGITLLDLNDDQEFKGHGSLRNVQKEPLSCNLLSPKLLKKLYKDHNNSYTSLNALSEINFACGPQEIQLQPPTQEEYAEELARQWDSLSKNLKKSFRRPEPGSTMTSEKAKQIDSIRRGVDGKKDIEGFKNFAVICLFPEFVDYYDAENDKRYFFEKDKYDLWTEHEVCP